MEQTLCKLTFVSSPDGAERIIDVMLAADPPVPGFTTWACDGHGFSFTGASIDERVRGRVRRRMVTAVLTRAGAAALVAAVETAAASAHAVYWIEPVETGGFMQRAEDFDPALREAEGD